MSDRIRGVCVCVRAVYLCGIAASGTGIGSWSEERAKSAISNDGCLYAVLEEAEGVSVSRMNCKLWRPRQVKDDEELWGGEGFARLIFCGQYAWRQQMHAQQLPHAAHAPPIPMMPHPGIAPPPGTASLLGLSALSGPGGHSLSMLTSKPELHRDDKSSSGKS
ncbi:hypothetical protein V9T40_011245 [Parthenolecanium corni]|uniref:Uncharacterized protein n=1 Tax=Parthenolecanium corni TaxID=536013 RepID=A0AAN9T6I0_9HEMI